MPKSPQAIQVHSKSERIRIKTNYLCVFRLTFNITSKVLYIELTEKHHFTTCHLTREVAKYVENLKVKKRLTQRHASISHISVFLKNAVN